MYYSANSMYFHVVVRGVPHLIILVLEFAGYALVLTGNRELPRCGVFPNTKEVNEVR